MKSETNECFSKVPYLHHNINERMGQKMHFKHINQIKIQRLDQLKIS